MKYLRSADLGFEKERQVVIPLRSGTAKKMYNSFKDDLEKQSQVQGVGASFYNPGIFNPSDNLIYKEGQTMNDARRTRMNWVDDGYLKTLKIQPVAGRLFSKDFPGDTSYRMILNETGIKELGFASATEAINKKVYFDYQGRQYGFDIIGVVKDFHYEDLHLPITPYGYQFLTANSEFNYMVVHAKPGDMGSLINSIETAWHKLNPNEPFEFSFLDDDFQKNYDAENRLASIVSYFTLIAILICCLGLFGLATFSAEQRIKEIGVRKVLGASVTGIVALLSKDFLKLVVIAIVIASPLAWYAMNKWLQDFAYRINLSWYIFLLAGIIAAVIAFATISFQAIRAANANPVKSLRTE
jgi:putative ABC transport system permease protein